MSLSSPLLSLTILSHTSQRRAASSFQEIIADREEKHPVAASEPPPVIFCLPALHLAELIGAERSHVKHEREDALQLEHAAASRKLN